MNIPNLITLSRLVITVACFGCMVAAADSVPEPATALSWTAFGLFLAAAATDFLDGMLARRLGQVTRFGRVADPFADKLLVCGGMVLLLDFPEARVMLESWMVVVVLAREFLVTSIRGLAEASGVAFPADRLGKWKMVMQCVAVSALLSVVAGSDVFRTVAWLSTWVMLALTVVSGLNYLFKAGRLLRDAA